MKKGTSYLVVAAMMMGLMLTGCGGNDNSGSSVTKATTETVTEDQDTEDAFADDTDTEDAFADDTDTEESSDTVDEEETEESADDSDEAEADPSLVGVYTENGYENSFFGFKINLDDSYTLQTRGSATGSTDASEIVEDSNSDETIQTAMDDVDSMFSTGTNYAFCANDGTHYILVRIKSPKGGGNVGYSVWADEETIVKSSLSELENIVSTTATQLGAEASNIESDYSECEIFGEQHYKCTATADMSGKDYSLTNVIIRSDDGKYEATIVIETLGDTNYQDVIDNCFSPL